MEMLQVLACSCPAFFFLRRSNTRNVSFLNSLDNITRSSRSSGERIWSNPFWSPIWLVYENGSIPVHVGRWNKLIRVRIRFTVDWVQLKSAYIRRIPPRQHLCVSAAFFRALSFLRTKGRGGGRYEIEHLRCAWTRSARANCTRKLLNFFSYVPS